MSELELVKVPLNKLESKIRSREDMFRLLQDSCELILL